jgi:hypothetical protein
LCKEVLAKIHVAGGRGGGIVGRQSGYPEELTGSFRVGRSNNGGIQVKEAPFVEELVHRKGRVVPNAHDGPKGVGPHAEVGNFPEEFQRVLFGLQGVGFRIGVS